MIHVLPPEVLAKILLMGDLRISTQVCSLWHELVNSICSKKYKNEFYRPLKKQLGLMFNDPKQLSWRDYLQEKNWEQKKTFEKKYITEHSGEVINCINLTNNNLISGAVDGSVGLSDTKSLTFKGYWTWHNTGICDIATFENLVAFSDAFGIVSVTDLNTKSYVVLQDKKIAEHTKVNTIT